MIKHPDITATPCVPKARTVCPHCGSDALDLGPGKGPHPASIVCSQCHRFIRWVGLPIDAAEARSFVMPFGKHKGTPMGVLPRGYLEWLAGNVTGRVGARARVLLGEGGRS